MLDINIWQYVDLMGHVENMVNGAATQIQQLLPVGIGLMFVLAVPRIIRRVINTFI